MTFAFAVGNTQQGMKEAMGCQQKRERWLARGLKMTVTKRMRGVWVVHDANGFPCAVRATWRDAYNTAYRWAYERQT